MLSPVRRKIGSWWAAALKMCVGVEGECHDEASAAPSVLLAPRLWKEDEADDYCEALPDCSDLRPRRRYERGA